MNVELEPTKKEMVWMRKSVWQFPMYNKELEAYPYRKHPARYPLELVRRVLFLCTRPYQKVFDPFLGSGTSAAGCLIYRREFTGYELSKEYFAVAKEWLRILHDDMGFKRLTKIKLVRGNSLLTLDELEDDTQKLCINSPPYWNIMTRPRTWSKEKRPRRYSGKAEDLGNIDSYKLFMGKLMELYRICINKLVDGGFMVIVVKPIPRYGEYVDLPRDVIRGLKNLGMLMTGEVIWNRDLDYHKLPWMKPVVAKSIELFQVHENILFFKKLGGG